MNTPNRLTFANKARSGFTLIELLVVIAIIAILAAILFPVFGRARENARRSSCQSNLKQIGLGIMQYSQDYDERMPSGRMSLNNADNVGGHWQVLMQPYVKSYQVFRCPSNTRNDNGMSDAQDSVVNGVTQAKVSYAAPIEVGGNGAAFGNRGAAGPSLSDFNNVAQTLMVVDSNTSSSDFRLTNDLWTRDGHVKSMKPLQTVSTTMGGSGSINMWNRFGTDFTDPAYNTRVMTGLRSATSVYN
ncbi:DUF1559 domain-containing protein [bacterium]|nr:MAG: DUF1559 domain-containing protein [bacterium]